MLKTTVPASTDSDTESARPAHRRTVDPRRRKLLAALLLAILLGGVATYLSRPNPQPVENPPSADVEAPVTPQVELPAVLFTDITQQAGIDFVHENGATGEKLLPETMGGGCAFFDFDNDGDQDLLLVNSNHWIWTPAAFDASPATMALYANDGRGQFRDVTAGSGLDVAFYGMGVAAGDYDNDGLVDVFLSAVGANRLFHNLGGGRFEDVTEAAGVAGADEDWGTSCGWLDYDRDGDLDLLVCNYVQWSREFDAAQNFQLAGGSRAYGRPQNFPGTFPNLYRNEGGGQFVDVTAEAGLQLRDPETGRPLAKSLGACFADFDQDGWIDIVVANDTIKNLLFRNQQNGKFREIGEMAGVAFDRDGNARGAMGIDVAAFRNSDELGIAIGNFSNEMVALYVAQNGQLVFEDQAIPAGLGPDTSLQLTFGLFFVDCDLDGRLDLFAANGHLEDQIQRVQPRQTYEQSPQLFWNSGPTSRVEFLSMATRQTGIDFARPLVGRGASYADIDSDGDLDLLITTVGRPPRLLRNDQSSGHHWLRVKLEGTTSPKDAIGAWVSLRLPDRTLRRQVMPTCSYLSQVELPVTFGLGDVDQIDAVTVLWPDGSEQSVEISGVDRTLTVRQTASPPTARD